MDIRPGALHNMPICAYHKKHLNTNVNYTESILVLPNKFKLELSLTVIHTPIKVLCLQ